MISNQQEDTIRLGRRIAAAVRAGDILCLFGDLGSGKTTLVKGFAEGLKVKRGEVSSPTFVLMNVYEGRLPVFHFDLYRLEERSQIMQIGYEEYLYGDGVAVIEWADRLKDLFPLDCLSIHLEHQGDGRRSIALSASGKRSSALLNKINL